MYLSVVNTKTDKLLYIKKTIRKGNVTTSFTVKKIGKLSELKLTYDDPIKHFTEVAVKMTEEDRLNNEAVLISLSPKKEIEKYKNHLFNGGYIFLKSLYREIGIDKLCKEIKSNYKIEYDLDNILQTLVYTRLIFPGSKKLSYELSQSFLEPPTYDLHELYRALDVLEENSDAIQAQLYKNTSKVYKREKQILYYDVTNYFFEIEEEDEFRKYGFSKEHRPNPIVQMGLFIDGTGIPLAFCINNGSQNEQLSLKPLEQKIINDFQLSKFVVCTDAGLNSNENKFFNNFKDRAFVCTQSVKKFKKYLEEWMFSEQGWRFSGNGTIDYKEFDYDEYLKNELLKPINQRNMNPVFYKERWVNDKVTINNEKKKTKEFEQRYILTFSEKYRRYQRNIRSSQIERAKRIIGSPSKFDKKSINDCKRFIKNISFTKDGEISTIKELYLDEDKIKEEEKYDGFYCITTNLEGRVEKILEINVGRWEIEENFRILKNEFKARPVFLQKKERIIAHFLTCFISLLLFRLLEKKLNEKYSAHQIVDQLRNFNFYQLKDIYYLPAYKRTDLTEDLIRIFDMDLNKEVLLKKDIKKFF